MKVYHWKYGFQVNMDMDMRSDHLCIEYNSPITIMCAYLFDHLCHYTPVLRKIQGLDNEKEEAMGRETRLHTGITTWQMVARCMHVAVKWKSRSKQSA